MAEEIRTIVLVSTKHCLKELDVQFAPCEDTMQRRGSCNDVACGLEQRN